ncbi:Acetyl-coenzyme A transporter 1 [Folsomia candida]|uniref:Acetyl-coenzyme A transporter 1 n=1 Tax=Folsomia candida TaxID=158441 RepID=A0A226F030_FOLCA|nr:Acetyl-coenzyme A transporter 1 [Folsomia candida]
MTNTKKSASNGSTSSYLEVPMSSNNRTTPSQASRTKGKRKVSSTSESGGIYHGEPDYKKDLSSILLLLFLYILQGIPLGLIASIPMILLNKSAATYTEQAKFSFAYWPFSLKLLWAPIVDSIYSERFGRRKTWLVPMQYLLGIFMFSLSFQVDGLLEQGNITKITAVFFCLNFLAATQDIAVDGWALTMLRRENVGYASTCNSVGQTAGYFLGYVVFLALESADFCNNYLRSADAAKAIGMVTLSEFLYFWSWVFLITTTLVWILKTEKPEEIDFSDEPRLSLVDSYKLLWHIIRLKSVKRLILFLLTCKIGFAAADSVTGLKLVEAGVPKDRLALLAIPMTPLQIVLPLFISKYTAGSKPMGIFIKAMPIRLVFGLIFAAIVYATPRYFASADGSYGWPYYTFLVLVYSIHQISVYSMFVAVMSFFAKISDPTVGGTYMTLLNTLSNLGGNWPGTLALWMACSSTLKSKCIAEVDGYYIESVICVIIGLIWVYTWGKPTINKLQSKSDRQWKVQSSESNRKEH